MMLSCAEFTTEAMMSPIERMETMPSITKASTVIRFDGGTMW